MVWQDDAGGIASRYLFAMPLGSELEISRDGDPEPVTTDGIDPAVAFDPAAGEFLVVWQRDAAEGGESTIFGRRVSAGMPLGSETQGIGGGMPLGSELQISSMPLGSELQPGTDPLPLSRDPDLAFDTAEEDFVVVWERRNAAGDARRIQGRRVSLEGAFSMPLGSELEISGMPLGSDLQLSRSPGVAFDSISGELLVVWQREDAAVTERRIVGRRVGLAGGMPLGSELGISSMPLGSELQLDRDPSVAFDADSEEFLVVWEKEQMAGAGAIIGRRVDIETLGGMPLGSELEVSAAGAGDARNPEISSSSGSFVVVWEEAPAGRQGAASEVLGRLLDSAGEPRNIEFQVGADAGADDSLPAIAFAPSGEDVAVDEFVVVWESEPLPGAEEVRGQLFVLTADLSIQLIGPAGPAAAGGVLSWTVVVANAGPADAEEVTVLGTLPEGVVLATTEGCAEDPDGAQSCALGTIVAGGLAQLTVTTEVDPGALGSLSYGASVESRASDPDETDNAAELETPVVAQADLGVSQTDDPDPVTAGQPVTYTVTVTNVGPADAVAVRADGILRASILSATAGCDEDPEGVPTCSLGTVAAGASREYAVVVEVDPAAGGPLEHTVVVSSETADPNAGDNASTETTAIDVSADLALEIDDDPDPAPVGGTVTYTFAVDNLGPSDASGVVVTDNLPAGMTALATAGCAEDPSGYPACTLGAVAAGTSRQYTLSAALDQAPAPLVNTAAVAAASPDPDLANNDASAETTPILSPATVSGTMEAAGIFTDGSIVTYTVVLMNDGPGTQLDNEGDEFVDDLPSELELLSATADAGTVGTSGGPARAGAVITWNGAIPAAGTVTIVIEARIEHAEIGQTITNQGTIHYDADGDGINESTVPTQDPAGGATSFVVLALFEIPALGPAGLAALALLLVTLALAELRRRTTPLSGRRH